MLRTPGGRQQVKGGVAFRLWPLLSRIARLHRRSVVRSTRVVAVVGTFGKSTTARAVATAIGAPVHAAMTYNAFASVARAVLRIRPGQRHAVIEVGLSGRGQMEAYATLIRPDVTVVTSIGSEHHPTMPRLENTREEKSHMVRALDASGLAVLNGDDPHVMWMATVAPGRIVTFGLGAHCDVRATDVRLDWPFGMRFRLHANGQTRDVAIRLIGRQMVYPALAAIAVALSERIPLDDAIARCGAMAPLPGRMEPVLLPSGAIVLRDDYKGTRETIHAALDVLAGIPAHRRIVLFGDLSEVQGREWRLYVTLGMQVATVASRLVTVGRGFRRYWAGARKAGMPRSAVVDAGRTVKEAASYLASNLGSGDVVLIKGRRGQKLDRVRLILEGRNVQCDIKLCLIQSECIDCPMLGRGWGKHRHIMPGDATTPVRPARSDRRPARG